MTPDERSALYHSLEAELGVLTFVDPEMCPPASCYEGEVFGGITVQRMWEGSNVLLAYVALTHHPGESSEALLIALHELGHIARHHQGRRRRFKIAAKNIGTLRREAEAWEWALSRLPCTPSAEDWAAILWRLKTYADYPKFKPDPGFTRLLEQAERNAAWEK